MDSWSSGAIPCQVTAQVVGSSEAGRKEGFLILAVWLQRVMRGSIPEGAQQTGKRQVDGLPVAGGALGAKPAPISTCLRSGVGGSQ